MPDLKKPAVRKRPACKRPAAEKAEEIKTEVQNLGCTAEESE